MKDLLNTWALEGDNAKLLERIIEAIKRIVQGRGGGADTYECGSIRVWWGGGFFCPRAQGVQVRIDGKWDTVFNYDFAWADTFDAVLHKMRPGKWIEYLFQLAESTPEPVPVADPRIAPIDDSAVFGDMIDGEEAPPS